MRKLFGGLLGGKGGTPELLKAVLEALASRGVSEEQWQQLAAAKDLEEVVEEEWPRAKLAELAEKFSPLVFHLCTKCHTSIQGIVDRFGPESEEEFKEDIELELVNSMIVLTNFLSCISSTGKEHPLASHLWAERGKEKPLAECIIDSALRVHFLDGFTVEPEEPPAEDQEPRRQEEGVEAAVLWAEGVGPEGGGPEKVSDDIRANRQLALQLLAAALCGGAPAAPPPGSRGGEAAPQSVADRAKYAEAMAAATLSGQEACRPLISDNRPLEYLCDPHKQVPRRAELFYSLLSVALGYDPHGYSVPYAGYFTGEKEETFTQLCLQVIGLLLLDPNDVYVLGADRLVSRRPQECRGSWSSHSWLSPRPHFFRKLLNGISSDAEVHFVVSGLVTLLGTVSDERGTYLPKSVKLPKFLSELLVLVLHVAGCDNLVRAASSESDVVDLAVGVLHVAAEAPEYINEDVLNMLIWSIFLRLTAHRTACVAFLDDFEGDVPDELPEAGGTFADLLFVAALKQLGEYFLTAKCHPMHSCVLDACLFCMTNLSPYAEGISKDAAHRLFALLERCGKSVQKRSSQKGAALLPTLLEILENSMQYQYSSNANLAYGIMARSGMLLELNKIVTQISQGSAEDGPAASPAAPNGLPASASAGSLSPRTEVSDVSATPVSQETKVLWSRNVKVHLDPLIVMLEAVLPELEAAVEKQEVSNPDDAKDLLPKCILGLLPPPPVFTTRSLASCDLTHRACEHVLVSCLAHGPLENLWDAGEEAEEDPEAAEEERRAKIKALAERPEEAFASVGGPAAAAATFAPAARSSADGQPANGHGTVEGSSAAAAPAAAAAPGPAAAGATAATAAAAAVADGRADASEVDHEDEEEESEGEGQGDADEEEDDDVELVPDSAAAAAAPQA